MDKGRLAYLVRRELIANLYASGSYALSGQLFLLLACGWITCSQVPGVLWLSWISVSFFILLCRTLHLWWRRYRRSASGKRLEYEYFISSTCNAIFWGMGLLFFMGDLSEPRRLVLILLSCLYVSGCAAVLHHNARCVYAAVIPIVLAIASELLEMRYPLDVPVLAIVMGSVLFAELLRRHLLRWRESGLYHLFISADMARQLRRKSENLKLAAQQDSLTSLANRRHFEEALELQWRRCSRAMAPLSLLLLDVDHFKRYNDRYGHLVGDLCLQQVAALLPSVLPREDALAARYGGEEFVVLLPFTDLPGAVRLAERIRAATADLVISHEDGQIDGVTCSLGVARVLPGSQMSRRELIEMADVALYRAKRKGRNRVEVAD